MKYKTEKELIELLRKLLKALQTAKPTIQQQRLRTEIIQKYSSSDYKRKGTVIAITKESTRIFGSS
ncbi:hypothetical protein PO124_25600 [Bacillus licheniformis]|nr:hypothetical protein [Bacillus licheniformis]